MFRNTSHDFHIVRQKRGLGMVGGAKNSQLRKPVLLSVLGGMNKNSSVLTDYKSPCIRKAQKIYELLMIYILLILQYFSAIKNETIKMSCEYVSK